MIPNLKSKNTAYIKYLASKDKMIFSVKRIIRDMKTLEDEMKNMPFISASPLDDNLFIWHGNLRGTEDNAYKGMTVHFTIRLPYNYPLSPPTISINTPLKHPNVFGSYLCLQMFDMAVQNNSKKWSSAYTLHSILLQLQSFLFDVKKSFFNKQNLLTIQEQIEDSADYECHACGHKGSSKPYPPFPIYKNTRESGLSVHSFVSGNVIDEDQAFTEVRDESSLYLDNVRCYHCKLDYKNTTIGYGVKSVKLPRTGDIKTCDPIVDHVCLHCYIKDGLYCSSLQELFNNWMPLFTVKEDWEKILKLARRSFSFIKTNSTKKFEPNFILACIPKMLTTMLYLMASKKKHPSVSYIRTFIQIHCMGAKFLEIYPELKVEMEKQIADFIASSENRSKNKISSILNIPIYLLFTNKYSFADIQDSFIEEDFSRRIFWILAKIPNLDFEKEISNDHLVVAFKAAVESYRIIMMLFHYMSTLSSELKTSESLMNAFEDNYGKLPNVIEDKIQRGLINTWEAENYNDFFASFGVSKTDEEVQKTLKAAYLASAERGYHGNIQKAFENKKGEFTTHHFGVSNVKTLMEVYEANNNSLEVKDDEARKVLADTFLWIRRTMFQDSNVSPAELADAADNFNYQFNRVNHDIPDPLVESRYKFRSRYLENTKTQYVSQPYQSDYTWSELLVKLLFEEEIRKLEWAGDFKVFHQILDVLKNYHFKGLVLYVIDISKIKMKYYYLTTILGKLGVIDHLVIKPSTKLTSLRATMLKELAKGLGRRDQFPRSVVFTQLEGSISHIDNAVVFSEMFVRVFEKLGKELKVLKFLNCPILNKLPSNNPFWKYILNVCSELEELTVRKFYLNHLLGLDEGIMNLRKLVVLDLQAQETTTNKNILENTLYNLNFTPTLKKLNFCHSIPKTEKLFFENISKLLKISSGLEILDLSFMTGIRSLFTPELAEALGSNKYLKILKLNGSASVSSLIHHLGRALAFNVRNKGQLKHLEMQGLIKTSTEFTYWVNGLNISNRDYEMVFGNVSNAQKMKNDDVKEVFTFGLETLKLDMCQFNRCSKVKFDTFFRGIRSKLHHLSLKNCGLTEAFFVSLTKMYKKEETPDATILRYLDLSNNRTLERSNKTFLISYLAELKELEFLDLRNNHLGVSFPKKFLLQAEDWLKNSKLTFLDMSYNSLKIDGMYGLSPCISQMKNIEWLDLSFNNLKDEGLRILSEELKSKSCTIDNLVFTNNFVTDAGFEKLVEQGDLGKLFTKSVYLRKNSISDTTILANLPNLSDISTYGLSLDLIDKFFFLDQSQLERTVYIPVKMDPTDVLRIFEKTEYEYLEDSAPGRLLSIRNRKIRTYFSKNNFNEFTFIEFETASQAEKGRMLGSKGAVYSGGRKQRVFLSGTSTFYFRKKRRNITKDLISATGVPTRR